MSADEFNIVVVSDYLSTSVRFDVSLGDLPRLVIEEPMRVSSPGHTSHVNSKTSRDQENRSLTQSATEAVRAIAFFSRQKLFH